MASYNNVQDDKLFCISITIHISMSCCLEQAEGIGSQMMPAHLHAQHAGGTVSHKVSHLLLLISA